MALRAPKGPLRVPGSLKDPLKGPGTLFRYIWVGLGAHPFPPPNGMVTKVRNSSGNTYIFGECIEKLMEFHTFSTKPCSPAALQPCSPAALQPGALHLYRDLQPCRSAACIPTALELCGLAALLPCRPAALQLNSPADLQPCSLGASRAIFPSSGRPSQTYILRHSCFL